MQDESNYEQVGKYRLLKKLATGGMAHIYLAEQSGLGGFKKRLVIKRILPHLIDDEKFLQMFQDEARVAAMMNHPNIVQIFELGEADNNYYIAMEYVAGYNLRAIIQMSNDHGIWLAPEYIAKLGSQICEGLEYAHNFCDDEGNHLNIIHRDVSPQNIILSNQGIIKIVDFGIAKAKSNAQETQAGIIKGKLAYMSPEQVKGQPLDRRSDLFSLGIVLYELATHQRPYQGKSDIDMLRAILESNPIRIETVRPDFPLAFSQIIYRALAKNREDRYPSARELQWDLEQFLQSSGKAVTTFQLRELVTRLEQLDQNHDKDDESSGAADVAAPTPAPTPAPAPAPPRMAARPGMPPPPPAFPGQPPGTPGAVPPGAKAPASPSDFDEDSETMWATDIKLPKQPPVATASSGTANATAHVVAVASSTARPMSALPVVGSAPHTTPAMGTAQAGMPPMSPPVPTIQPAPTTPAQVPPPPQFPGMSSGSGNYAAPGGFAGVSPAAYANTMYADDAQPSWQSPGQEAHPLIPSNNASSAHSSAHSSAEWEEDEATVLSHSPVAEAFRPDLPQQTTASPGMMAPTSPGPTPSYAKLGNLDLDTIVEPGMTPVPPGNNPIASDVLNSYLPPAPRPPMATGSGGYPAQNHASTYPSGGNGIPSGIDAPTILDQPSLSNLGIRGSYGNTPSTGAAVASASSGHPSAASNRQWPPRASSSSPPASASRLPKNDLLTQPHTYIQPKKGITPIMWAVLAFLLLGGAGVFAYFFFF